jgi:hypothetical protein
VVAAAHSNGADCSACCNAHCCSSVAKRNVTVAPEAAARTEMRACQRRSCISTNLCNSSSFARHSTPA